MHVLSWRTMRAELGYCYAEKKKIDTKISVVKLVLTCVIQPPDKDNATKMYMSTHYKNHSCLFLPLMFLLLTFTLWLHVMVVFRPFFVLSHDLSIWDLMFKSHVQLLLSCFDLCCLIIWIINVNSNYIFLTILCLDRKYLHRIYQGHNIVFILIPDKKVSASAH